MADSGDAIMGAGRAAGPDRAVEAIKNSLDSPLLLSTDIQGAKNILLNISYGEEEVTMDEVSIVTDYLQKQVGPNTQIIWGATPDETLGEELNVTIVATGFNLDTQAISNQMQHPNEKRSQEPEKPVTQAPPKEEKKISLESYYGRGETDNFMKKNPPQGTFPKQGAYPKQGVCQEENKRVVTLDLDDDANLDQMENIPAYKRKQQGGDVSGAEHLSSDNISRFSIKKEGDELKLNKNDYLHNKPD